MFPLDNFGKSILGFVSIGDISREFSLESLTYKRVGCKAPPL